MKNFRFNFVYVCFITLLLCSAASGFAGEHDPRLQKLLKAWWEIHASEIQGPSFVAGIVEGEQLIHFKSHGESNLEEKVKPTQDTLFRIGSLTKVFTGMGILQLRDRRKLRLDDLLTDHIPELKTMSYPLSTSPHMTIRDLLTHTSALPRMIEGGDWLDISEIIGFTSKLKLSEIPGARFSYSNLAFALLGEVIARVSGMSWEQYTRQYILQPLDMNQTFFHQSEFAKEQMAVPYTRNDDGSWKAITSPELYGYASAGAIYSSVTDIAKFMSLSLSRSPSAAYDSVLSLSSRLEMQRPQYVTDMTSGSAIGFPWFISTHKNGALEVGHGGNIDGFECQFLFDPHRNIGAVILANHMRAGLGQVAPSLLQAVRKTKMQAETRIMRDVSERLLNVLRDPTLSSLRAVMSDYILSDGGEDMLLGAFLQQKEQLGLADAYSSLKASSPHNFTVKVLYIKPQAENAKTELKLNVVIDESTPAKITGIWLK